MISVEVLSLLLVNGFLALALSTQVALGGIPNALLVAFQLNTSHIVAC